MFKLIGYARLSLVSIIESVYKVTSADCYLN